jgi:hypothetical protein
LAADNPTGCKKEGDGEVCEKSLEMRPFLVFPYPEEAEPNLSGPPQSLGAERMKKPAPTEAVGRTIGGG